VLGRWEKVIRGSRGLGDMYVLLLGLGFGCRVGGFQNIRLDRRRRGNDDRQIPGFRALSRTYAAGTESARFRRRALWGGVFSELFGGDEFGPETSPSDAQFMRVVDERLGTPRVGILCNVRLSQQVINRSGTRDEWLGKNVHRWKGRMIGGSQRTQGGRAAGPHTKCHPRWKLTQGLRTRPRRRLDRVRPGST